MARHSKQERIHKMNEEFKANRLCLACAGPCRCFRGVDRAVHKPTLVMEECVVPGCEVWNSSHQCPNH